MTPRSATVPRPADSHENREPTVWESLGGYRLLRVIGSGSRSVVYLAADRAGEVAVKAVGPAVPVDSFVAETACLATVSSPHVVRILDVSVVAGRPRCVIMERLSGPTVATLLDERSALEQGEAVTLAVSILRGVRAVHAAGWTHGAVSLAHVRLDAGGRPVLIAFGNASRATAAGLHADWIAAADAVDRVVDRIDFGDERALQRCRDAIRSIASANGDEAASTISALRELFALGPAAPVSLVHDGAAPAGGTSRRHQEIAVAGEDTRALQRETAEPSHTPDRDRVPQVLLALMEHGVSAAITTRLRTFARERRRPLAVAVSVASAIALGVLLLLPPSGSAGHATSTPVPAVRSDLAPRSVSTHPPPSPSRESVAGEHGDPVNAALKLLALRSDYLEAADVAGLAAIEQAGSPIFAADTALVSTGRHQVAKPTASQLSLAESLGDAAVITVAPFAGKTTKPASALLIRTDAGWRLRELFEN